MKLCLLLIGYNRKKSFSETLDKFKFLISNSKVDLVISLDDSYNNHELSDIAESFLWHLGDKQVLRSKTHKGLKKNIIDSCNYVSEKYSFFLVIEDDIDLSKYALIFLERILDSLKDYPKLGGISLYSYEKSEKDLMPFKPVFNGYINYWMQFPSSWGQLFSSHVWKKFDLSLKKKLINLDIIPNYVKLWPNGNSWKKYYLAFMIENDYFFAYPFNSYSSNRGEKGVNHNSIKNLYKVTLSEGVDYGKINKSIHIQGYYDHSFNFNGLEIKKNAKWFFNSYSYKSLFYFKILLFALINDFKIILIKILKLKD